MKIINLSFSNINSLAGTWSIDFENPSYSEGLFALTGPTGAGKTSVLDAVCLALYGQTVREDPSKDHNEVMTRGTGKCHAEVTFEVDGKRYRSRWGQARAREKPEGTLQHAEREIVSAADGAVLASQIRLVEAKILEVTGMSFEQFTRAVLLAQGQFDTFLKAEDSERADILEKITNTGIFSRIGSAAFARFQEERRKKEELESAQASIAVMTSEDRGRLDEQLAGVKQRQSETSAELELLSGQATWLASLATLQKVQTALVAEKVALDACCAASQPDLDKLVAAETARKLDLDLQALENERVAWSKAKNELASRELHSRESQTKQLEIVPKLTAVADLADDARRKLEGALPKLAEIRELDKKITFAEQARVNAAGVLSTAAQQHGEAVKVQAEAKSNLADAQAALAAAEGYQRGHALDGTISVRLPPIETKRSAWEILKRNADAAQTSSVASVHEAVTAGKKATEAAAKYKTVEKTALTAQSNLDSKLPELETIQKAKESAEREMQEADAVWSRQKPALDEQLELAETKLRLAQQVADLEERRKQLVDGEPCPLCGAVEHPYALGNIPAISGAEQELQAIKTKMAKLEKTASVGRITYDAASRALQKQQEIVTNLTGVNEKARNQILLSAQAVQTAADAARNALRLADLAASEAKRSNDEAETAWVEIAKELTSLAVSDLQAADWGRIAGRLKKRQAAFDEQEKIIQSSTVRIEETLKAIEGAGQRVQSAQASKAGRQSELAQMETALAALSAARKTQYGDLVPDFEEKQLRTAKEKAEKNHAAIVKGKASIDQAVLTAIHEVGSAQTLLQEAKARLQSAAEVCLVKVQKAGFADEVTCRAARWTDQEVVRATALRKALETQIIELKTKYDSNELALAVEQAKALSERSAAELSAEIELKQAIRDANDVSLKDLEFNVRKDNENRVKQASHGSALETQKVIFARWKKMNEMIGNEGGARFKKYAQGITLSRLLKVANPHLASMTNNRYALLWNVNDGDGLLPAIIDNHQAEAKRPTSNLSGGETFMVSLALALGLSGMASGKLQVDSLFLDEGFGTLDNDALDRAIGTLNQLHQTQGKLIGVISHIDQLKNQISTKIEVTKLGNGRSKLSGPGVQRLTHASETPPSADQPPGISSGIPKRRGRSAKKSKPDSAANILSPINNQEQ